MKINLLRNNPAGCLKDYINIDSCVNQDGTNKGPIDNLDWVADSGEVGHLIANDILNYFMFPQLNIIIDNWVSKISVKGKITISGVDFEEVGRGLILGELSTEEASKLLWGNQSNPLEVRISGLSIIDVTKILESKGLKITKAVFEDYSYLVEATR